MNPLSRDFRLMFVSLLSIGVISGGPRLDRPFVFDGIGVFGDDGRSFSVSDFPNYQVFHEGKELVMVSFKPGSSFSSKLRRDKRIRAFYSNQVSGVGRAVLIVSSPSERAYLAATAHEDTGACGSIEILSPGMMLSSSDLGDAASPIIATSIKSSAIAGTLSEISTDNIKATTQSLESLGTRYHGATAPNIASDSIKSSWQTLAPSGATVSQYDHAATGKTSQKSVIMTIPGSSYPSERVVLGAHLDSINRSDETKAPGADDDASGIAALTEIIRIIKAKNMQFQRTIEFHAYAAEEDGLIGSKDIATNAQLGGKIITAMLQLDMIGYSSSPEEILHIITTDTSPILVRHLKDLASNYLGNTWQTAELAAGTSDHKSWTSNGFHAAFAFENPLDYNNALHTENDTIARINFSLAAKFTKLALAFLSHEAGYTAAVADTAAQWAAQKATSSIIKLAALKSSTGGDRLVAAVEGAATTAEFCKIKSGLEVGCQSMVTETSLEKQKSNRVFFLSASDLTINEDDIWRVSAYSSSGELVAMRRMRLKKN